MSARMKLAGLITALVLAAGSALAQTPNIAGPMVPNGGGSGGSTSPGGSNGQLQYNNAGSFGGLSGTSWDDTNRSLTLTGATVTTSNPVLNLSQTWNAGGVTFTGLKFNATDTASAAGSLLLDLQVATASKFNVTKAGNVVSNATGAAPTSVAFAVANDITTGLYSPSTSFIGLSANSTPVLVATSSFMRTSSASVFQWTSGSAQSQVGDTGLARNAAGVVEVNNGTAGSLRDLTARFMSTQGESRVTTQFDKTSDAALANVTGLSVTVTAAKTYLFEADLYTSSNASGGVQAAISGTATATAITYDTTITNAGTITQPTRSAALGTAGGVTAVTAAWVHIKGTITVNAGGTLTVQFAQNASNGTASSVLVGSTFIVTQF